MVDLFISEITDDTEKVNDAEETVVDGAFTEEEFDEYYDENGLSINIENFSGPLDLLLQLVNAAKIEIKDIFISDITDQFLKYIEQIDVLDVDKASEYMYIAATLTEIKSHDMLPPPEE